MFNLEYSYKKGEAVVDYLEFEWITRNFVFRFETERVLSIQKPSGIWTNIETMQNNLKPSKIINF